MKRLTLCVSLVMLTEIACGQEALREVSWSELSASGALEYVEVVKPRGGKRPPYVRIANPLGTGRSVTLPEARDVGAKGMGTVVSGEVKYEDCEPAGQFEARASVESGPDVVMTTRPGAGPMSGLQGTADWRLFRLLLRRAGPTPPTRVTLNVQIPGKGEVMVGPVDLLTYSAGVNPMAEDAPLEVERTFGWDAQGVKLPRIRFLKPDGQTAFERVEVTNPFSAPTDITLFALQDHGLKTTEFALSGTAQCESVGRGASLHMRMVQADGTSTRTTTKATSGPQAPLTGTAGWRDILVPALPEPAAVPRTIEVSLAFDGRGKVTLGPLAFVRRSADAAQAEGTRPRAQWSQDGPTLGRMAGLFSTLVGALVLVALIATSVATTVLSRAGRAESTVTAVLVGTIGLGGACAAAGALAWILGQPTRVYLALMLPGLIAVVVGGKLYPTVKGAYANLQLQQLTQTLDRRREV